jgi:glucose-6-phosphate dehydrogenase assembly protein OpcA
VDALVVTDVPTTLVWLGRVHADDPAFAPLAASASRIVFDSSVGSLASLAHVVYWARARAPSERPGVADLTWTRIAPWQELCARLFDEPRVRHLASSVTRVTLTQASQSGAGLAPEGTMLLGWLATSLGWRAASLAGKLRLLRPDEASVNVQLSTRPAPAPPGSLVALRVEASAGDLSLVGEVERESEPSTEMATWRLAVSSGGQTSRLEQRVQLRGSDPARLLERTLHRPPHDGALLDAVAWADELRGEELACG